MSENKTIVQQVRELGQDLSALTNKTNQVISQSNYLEALLAAVVEVLGRDVVQAKVHELASQSLQNTEARNREALVRSVETGEAVSVATVGPKSVVLGRWTQPGNTVATSWMARSAQIYGCVGRNVGDTFSPVRARNPELPEGAPADTFEIVMAVDPVQATEQTSG